MNYVETAEDVGFDSIFVVDHGWIPFEALTTLSVVAMKTKMAKLGTAVLDPSRRTPATLAHATATLDRISGGRLILGLGAGGKDNDPIYGFTVTRRVSRLGEVIDVVKKFWTEPTVTYDGRFFTYENASIAQKPVQIPHPAIWVAGYGSRMKKIAAMTADGFITQYLSPRVLKEEIDVVREEMRKFQRDPTSMEFVFCNPTSIALDYDKARGSIDLAARTRLARTAHYFAKRLGYDVWTKIEDVPQSAVDECFVFGTPEDCISKINGYIKIGMTYYIAQYLDLAGLKLFGERVIPYFR